MCNSAIKLLWLISVLSFVVTIECRSIVDLLSGGDYLYEDEIDYDLQYDQRQNGSINFKLGIDGVVVAVPQPDMSSLPLGLLGLGDLSALAGQYMIGDEGEDDYFNVTPSSTETSSESSEKPFEFEKVTTEAPAALPNEVPSSSTVDSKLDDVSTTISTVAPSTVSPTSLPSSTTKRALEKEEFVTVKIIMDESRVASPQRDNDQIELNKDERIRKRSKHNSRRRNK